MLNENLIYKVLKLSRIFNFSSVIDIVGGDNQCFIYTGSGCDHVLRGAYKHCLHASFLCFYC